MRSIVLALAFSMALPSVQAFAATKPAKVKVKRNKIKAQKPKKIKAHKRSN